MPKRVAIAQIAKMLPDASVWRHEPTGMIFVTLAGDQESHTFSRTRDAVAFAKKELKRQIQRIEDDIASWRGGLNQPHTDEWSRKVHTTMYHLGMRINELEARLVQS